MNKIFAVYLSVLIYFICNINALTLPEFILHNNEKNSRKFEINHEIIKNGNFKVYNNSLCDFHLNKIYEGIKNREIWALQLIDSWGKIPSGILKGHTTEFGNFDECLELDKHFEENLSILRGQYCLASLPLGDIISPNSDVTRNSSKAKVIISPQSLNEFRIGICFPDSCRPYYFQQKLIEFLQQQFPNTGILKNLTISKSLCATNEPVKFRKIDRIAIIVYSILGGIVLASTVYDFVIDSIKGKKFKILTTFSVLTNGKKIFKMTKQSNSNDSLECVNGIRFLSLVWIMFCHAHAIVGSSIINLADVSEWLKTPYSMLIQSATVSVDSFLLLSGLLVAWVGLKEFEKGNLLLRIPMMYIHRYIRITSLLGFTILFVISIAEYFGSGPLWYPFIQNTGENCKKWWWTTILHVQNYVNPDEICLPHSWYLSIDTQLYLISPLLLIPLKKWGIKFIWLPILLALGSVSAAFALFYIHDYPLLLVSTGLKNEDRFKFLYYPTHTRLSSWIIGLLLGYFLHLRQGKPLKIPIYGILIGWISSLVTIAAIIFGYYGRLPPNPEAILVEGAFYESLSRISWSLALAWVIYACVNGYGCLINDFLSLPIWQPLSRLSYSMYISHYIIEFIIDGHSRTAMNFSNFDIITHFYSTFGITLLVSVGLVLIFESPFISLERWLFDKLLKLTSHENPGQKSLMKDISAENPVTENPEEETKEKQIEDPGNHKE